MDQNDPGADGIILCFCGQAPEGHTGVRAPEIGQGPVIMDYLQQQGQLEVRELLRTAPQLSTPGEMIKYILDKQKTTSLTNEGLAAAIVAAVGARQP